MLRGPPGGRHSHDELLRDVATAVDGGGGREDGAWAAPDAEAAWLDLVTGRAPIVGHFDRDGRRYLVTQPTRSRGGRTATLTDRERSVVLRRAAGAPLKDIAAELGIGISTVAKALARALEKLGLQSHVELVQVFGSNGHSEGTP
jgi:DNA-binding CsgD family transcriptional regulator